jgi:hypothetical protein
MTAAEIDEGAWEAAWQAFRSMCRHGYIPDKTDLGVALRAYLKARPLQTIGLRSTAPWRVSASSSAMTRWGKARGGYKRYWPPCPPSHRRHRDE